MAIRVAGPGQAPVDVAVTMRTPGHDAELAVGFLVSEGLLAPADLVGVAVEDGDPAGVATPENELVVRIGRPFDPAAVPAEPSSPRPAAGSAARPRSTTSRPLRAAAARTAVEAPSIAALPDASSCRPGGLRADRRAPRLGLFDPAGTLLAVREDVGRHNALDKLIGAAALAGELPLHDRVLAVSGRVSFEIVQKAAVAGIPIVAAVSAPTDLAVSAAERLGQTLIGFVRDGGFNVYAGEERIALG